jgi:2-C-methyl-D-erythritol 4-phosphate cytidylyltransferase
LTLTHPLHSPGAQASAILVAAGNSARLFASGHRGPVKQLFELEPGRPLFLYALEALEAAQRVAEVVLVVRGEDRALISQVLARRGGLGKVRALVEGGSERQASVRQGVRAADQSLPLLAIHDAARPLVSSRCIDTCIAAAAESGAALVALPLVDTIKRSSDGKSTRETLERSTLWAAQTPQCFDAPRFRALIEAADGPALSDDAGLWERHIGPVRLVLGERKNMKVTQAEDLALLRCFLAESRSGGWPPGASP